MKKIFYSALILPLFVACGGDSEHEEASDENSVDTIEVAEDMNEPEVVNSFIIQEGEVGIFTIGHPVPVLPEELKIRQGSMSEIEDEVNVEFEVSMIFNHLEDVVDLKLENSDEEFHEDKNIIAMYVHSNYYHTELEIGVGSTIQEFMDTYSDYVLYYNNAQESFIIETPALPHIYFMLDGGEYNETPAGNSEMEELDPLDFAEGASIKSITVL